MGLKIGDTVIIERSGDVIPKIIKVLTKLRIGTERTIRIPTSCPRCGALVQRISTEVAYRCPNKNCYAVNWRQINHFVSKEALDIPGLGPKLIDQLMKAGLIEDAADLYTLRKEDLLSLDRWAEKKADNIVKMIAAHREIELSRFIYALGIKQVGAETARLLGAVVGAKEKRTKIRIKDLIKSFQAITLAQLTELEDIGPVVAKNIYNFWRDPHNLALLAKFSRGGIELTIMPTKSSEERPLFGLSFVLSGTLSSLTRGEAQDRIRNRGGKVKANLSPETSFLVLGANPGTKYTKAKDLGVKIINETEFLDLIK